MGLLGREWQIESEGEGAPLLDSLPFFRHTLLTDQFRLVVPALPASLYQLFQLVLLLSFPSLTLIDSAHFQFNSAMLGLALWSLVLLREGARDGLACVLFVASLGFKQIVRQSFARPLISDKDAEADVSSTLWPLVRRLCTGRQPSASGSSRSATTSVASTGASLNIPCRLLSLSSSYIHSSIPLTRPFLDRSRVSEADGTLSDPFADCASS